MPVKGSCHCGATQYEIDFTPTSATRCNCTYCTKKGALWVYATPEQFRLLTAMDTLALYTPTSPENLHYFCRNCGCVTFENHPDYSAFTDDWDAAEAGFDPARRRISVNLWTLDDIDIAAVPVVEIDGRNLW